MNEDIPSFLFYGKELPEEKSFFPFSFLCGVKGQSEFMFLNLAVHWDFIICH